MCVTALEYSMAQARTHEHSIQVALYLRRVGGPLRVLGLSSTVLTLALNAREGEGVCGTLRKDATHHVSVPSLCCSVCAFVVVLLTPLAFQLQHCPQATGGGSCTHVSWRPVRKGATAFEQTVGKRRDMRSFAYASTCTRCDGGCCAGKRMGMAPLLCRAMCRN